jgi:hypothetical protein
MWASISSGSVMRASALAGSLFLVAAATPAEVPDGFSQAPEEKTVEAFAAWIGEGNTLQTSADVATFAGTLVGQVYVKTDKGPVPGGQIICPAMVRINKDASQIAQASCVITAADDARIYADIACKGVYLLGCEGDLTLTGGTKRFAGISGTGPVLIRSEKRDIVGLTDKATRDTGNGVLYLPALRYRLP